MAGRARGQLPGATAAPLAEHRLMLLLAAQESEAAALLVQNHPVRFDVLMEMLSQRRLLGLLGTRLIAAIGPAGVPDEFLEAVDVVVAEGRRRAEFQQMASWGILGALADAGVLAMPLKGAFFGEWLHGDPGLRLSEDIDMVVSPHQMREALVVFEQLGYLRPLKHDQLPRRLHHILRAAGELPTVELHWRLHWYETQFACDMLARSTVVDGALRRAAPMDELMALLLIYARDGFVGLRLPIDIGAWWAVNGVQIDAAAVVEALEAYPELTRATGAAALAVSQILGLSLVELVPETVAEPRRTQLALKFANHAGADIGRPADQAAVIDGLLSPIAGVPAFARRQFWPALPGGPSFMERVLYAAALGARSAALVWRVSRLGGSGT